MLSPDVVAQARKPGMATPANDKQMSKWYRLLVSKLLSRSGPQTWRVASVDVAQAREPGMAQVAFDMQHTPSNWVCTIVTAQARKPGVAPTAFNMAIIKW